MIHDWKAYTILFVSGVLFTGSVYFQGRNNDRKYNRALYTICNRTNDARAELYLIRQPGEVDESYGGPALKNRLPIHDCRPYLDGQAPTSITSEQADAYVRRYYVRSHPEHNHIHDQSPPANP